MFGYIYKTTNIINNRCYIGKKESSVFVPTYLGSGTVLSLAVKKYGKENFLVEVLHWAVDSNQLDSLEIKEISEHRLTSDLYNLAEGGTGGNTTEHHPDKSLIIEKRAKKLVEWHASLSHEEQTIRSQKISAAKKGKANGHAGLKHKPETIEKIKAANKSYVKDSKWKDAHAAASEKRRGIPLTKKYKSVIVNDIEYISVQEAMVALGIKHRATFYDRIKRNLIKVKYI